MKLRLQANELRVRVDREDIDTLRAEGRVDARLDLGGRVLTWALFEGGTEEPTLTFDETCIEIGLGPNFVAKWATTNELGIETTIGTTRVIVEKDLKKR